MEQVAKLASNFHSDEIVEITLEDGGHYTVQRAILCHASEYFRSALRGSFAEAKNKKLVLPGCDTEIFELLLYWLCNRSLPDLESLSSSLSWKDEDRAKSEEAAVQLQIPPIRLWHVAGMLLMPALQNDAMDCLMSILKHIQIESLSMEVAFELGSSDCVIRRMLLDEFVLDWCENRTWRRPHEMADFAAIPGFFDVFASMVHPDIKQPAPGKVKFDKQLRSSYMMPV